jgi:hypothetical protein
MTISLGLTDGISTARTTESSWYGSNSIPARKGDWIRDVSAMEDAPLRTASRKASRLAGASKPVGSGRAIFSSTLAPGSNSQITWSSSPRPSSSMEINDTNCPRQRDCGQGAARCRTSASCPCSGGADEKWTAAVIAIDSGGLSSRVRPSDTLETKGYQTVYAKIHPNE